MYQTVLYGEIKFEVVKRTEKFVTCKFENRSITYALIGGLTRKFRADSFDKGILESSNREFGSVYARFVEVKPETTWKDGETFRPEKAIGTFALKVQREG
jgi:hypothetical protein